MTNPTYSSDPADQSVDPREMPAYDPSQDGPETPGYNETPGYAGSPTYTEPIAGNPYTAPTGDPYTTTTGDSYAVGETGYSADQPATGDRRPKTWPRARRPTSRTPRSTPARTWPEPPRRRPRTWRPRPGSRPRACSSTATSELRSQADPAGPAGLDPEVIRRRTARTRRRHAAAGVTVDRSRASGGREGFGDRSLAGGPGAGRRARGGARFRPPPPRRVPGLCALAGVLAGRVTRGAVAANTSVDSPDPSRALTDRPLDRRRSVRPARTYAAPGAVASELRRRRSTRPVRRRTVPYTDQPCTDQPYTDRGEPTR